MTVNFNQATQQQLDRAKAGIPEEDAFEVLIVAKRFPPTAFPKIDGVVIEPDQKLQTGLLTYLSDAGIQSFESPRAEYCDALKGETLLLAAAAQLERIAAIPEVIKIELRACGGHLIDEFNAEKKRLLVALQKDQSDERPTRLPTLYAMLKDILSTPCLHFRP